MKCIHDLVSFGSSYFDSRYPYARLEKEEEEEGTDVENIDEDSKAFRRRGTTAS